jgi:hypothetical protein
MNEIVRINDENPTYSSINLATASRPEQQTFFNAIENPEEKLSSYINKRIKFSNVYMEQIFMCEYDDAGVPIPNTEKEAIKTVLITPEGKGVISTSMGIARALYRMFQIFGTPDTWDAPMECIVQQVEIGKNRTFKLKVV